MDVAMANPDTLPPAGHVRFFLLPLLGLVLVVLSACRAAPPRHDGPFLVPAGESDYLLFSHTSVIGPQGRKEAVPAGAGRVVGAAVSLVSGWACVAYQSQMAFVDLASGEILWARVPVGDADFVSLGGEAAAYGADDTVTFVRVPTGEELWREDTSPWLEERGLARLDYVWPLSEDEFLLLGSKAPGVSWAKVVVQKITRAYGRWQALSTNDISKILTWVDRCVSDGEGLYVVGVKENLQMGTRRRPGRLWHNLVAVHVDPGDWVTRTVIDEEQQQRETLITDIAVGPGLLAIVRDASRLDVYEVYETGQAVRPAWGRSWSRADAVTYLSPEELVVQTGEGFVKIKPPMTDR